MPIDYDYKFEGVVSIFDPDTCEYKKLGPATHIPDLESDPEVAYADCIGHLQKLGESFGSSLTGTIECTADGFKMLTLAFRDYEYYLAKLSMDRRKIKRAKRRLREWKRKCKEDTNDS